jgi:integrase
MTSGKKYWRLRYFKDGKRSWHTIGEYPATGLQEAREKRNDLRRKLREGAPLSAKSTLFRDVALEWAHAHDQKIANENDRIKMRGRMNNHLLPFLGEKEIASIAPADVLAVLQRLAGMEKWEMLSRVRSVTSQIFRYGVATGRVQTDPTYALRGAIIAPKKRHFPSIRKPAEVGALMRSIDAYPFERVRYAMWFSALTFCRPGEIRRAEWSEIDMDRSEWTIPEEKMKMRRPHIVPLSRQAVEVLKEMADISRGGKYVFPSNRTPLRPMSDATVLAALRSMGYPKDQMTPHGFRSMASTLLNENGFNVDWIERQLAHVEGNGVRAAYNYAEYLPERRKMMQWWADYLDELRETA